MLLNNLFKQGVAQRGDLPASLPVSFMSRNPEHSKAQRILVPSVDTSHSLGLLLSRPEKDTNLGGVGVSASFKTRDCLEISTIKKSDSY